MYADALHLVQLSLTWRYVGTALFKRSLHPSSGIIVIASMASRGSKSLVQQRVLMSYSIFVIYYRVKNKKDQWFRSRSLSNSLCYNKG